LCQDPDVKSIVTFFAVLVALPLLLGAVLGFGLGSPEMALILLVALVAAGFVYWRDRRVGLKSG
jgi:hypothetical protein